MQKVIRKVFVSCLMTAGAVGASGAVFPAASGDISSEAAWGSPIPTLLELVSGTYYASGDVSFSDGLGFTQSNADAVIDQTDARAKADAVISFGGTSIGASTVNDCVTFKGGIYDFGGKKLYLCPGSTGSNKGIKLQLTDGAVVRNVAQFQNSWSNPGEGYVAGTLIVSDDSQFTCNDVRMTYSNSRGRIEVLSGGMLTVSKQVLTDAKDATGDSYHQVVVDGEDSQLTVGDYFYLGRKYSKNTLQVSNGGTLNVSSTLSLGFGEQSVSNEVKVLSDGILGALVYVGRAGSGNRLIVSNATVKKDISAGVDGTSQGNRIDLLDGGVAESSVTVGKAGSFNTLMVSNATISGAISSATAASSQGNRIDILDGSVVGSSVTVGEEGNFNTLIVSNATVNGAVYAGNNGSSNRVEFCAGASMISDKAILWCGNGVSATGNEIVFSGAETTLSLAEGRHVLFGDGHGNKVTFTDGFTWTTPDLISYGYCYTSGDGTKNGWGNTVEISRNAVITNNNADNIGFYLGYGRFATCCSNRLHVVDGGELVSKGIYTDGHDNVMLISNATVKTSSGYFYLGAAGYSGLPVFGNRLEFRGQAPVLNTVGGRSYVQQQSVVRFVVPAEGFDQSDAIWNGWKMSFDADTELEIDAEAWLANEANNRAATYRLVYASSELSIPNEVIERANARLPEKCRLYVGTTSSTSQRTLYLRLDKPRGMVLIFR